MSLFGRRWRRSPAGEVSLEAAVARAAMLLGWEGHLAADSETLVVTRGSNFTSVGITPALRSIPDGADPEQAARWIADHVRASSSMEPESPLGDWSAIAGRVRTTLNGVGPGRTATGTDLPLHRVVADGLVEHLVVDYPERIVYVKDVPEEWPMNADAALAAGRKAVHDDEPVGPYMVEEFAGSGVLAFSGSPYYSATHALMLSNILELPPAGGLVAVPGSHVLLVAPLTGQPVLAAIRNLWSMTEQLYATAERPVSDAVFHVTGHRFERVAFRNPPGDPTDITLTPNALRLV